MSRSMICCSMFAVVVCAAVRVGADDGPAKDVPELQVLQHYVGTWDVAITTKDSGFTKGESTAKWILDGRFVEQSGTLLSRDGSERIKVTSLMTYDTTKKAYRYWSFDSNGSVSESEGTWDAKSKTMTSVTHPDEDGTRATVTADFSTPRTEKWKFVFTDRTGNETGELRGENTLRAVKR